ncbi:hypothetical protein DH2020_021139 [Rehmannia glutinosa]|uniref:Endonuclease/exonuclease/phosphatase domain-containing protein n=1 Tax=Rehmannia glutinosa TaxID=99300 RepID=A0ABR0WE09_REHGL
MDVTVKSYSEGHIDGMVADGAKVWRFTGFYGNPDSNLRKFSWDLLRKLYNIQELRGIPWLIGGDFNEICYENEKMGGRVRANSQMRAFCDVLAECELRDIFCGGEFFTWVGRRLSSKVIFERLDRFVSTEEWRQLFSVAKAVTLEFYNSDHRPVELSLGSNQSIHGLSTHPQRKKFKFETCWMEEQEFRNIVEEGWGASSDTSSIQEQIRRCGELLEIWAGTRFRKLSRTIAKKRKQLNSLKVQSKWNGSTRQIDEIEGELEKLISQEEGYWKQHSRNTWLAQVDANTKYFHTQASTRKSKNHIRGLMNSHRDFCTDQVGMSEIIIDYFENLFHSTQPSEDDMRLVRSSFPEFIAKEILEIPLPNDPTEDCRYWRFSSKGLFSVREGYRLEIGMYDTPLNSGGSRNSKMGVR